MSSDTNNNNTNNMSSREMKKWQIDRVQTVLKNRIRKLDAERTQIKSDAEQVKSDRTTPSRTLLTGASFAAPLILSLYAVDPSRYYVLIVLAVDIVFALIMYKINTSTSRRIHKLILSTDAAFLLAIEKLNYFRDYFDMDIYDIDNITKEKIDRFFNYHTSLRLQHKLG